MPSLFVFQSDDPHLNNASLSDYETEFGVVQWFLETRITNILKKNWFNKPEKFFKKNPNSVQINETKSNISPHKIEELTKMGFEKEKAKLGLQNTGDDLQKAITLLVSGDVIQDKSEDKKKQSNPNIKRLVFLGLTEEESKKMH